MKLWEPDPTTIAYANLTQTMGRLGLTSYDQLYTWSIREPEAFWGDVITTLGIRFSQPPSRVLDAGDDPRHVRWLPGAQMNIAASCFQADANAPAILSGDAGGVLRTTSYGELRKYANRVAHGLRQLGLCPGDGVAIFMPMNARSVEIYLGIVLAGCVVVSVAESFAADQVKLRLQAGQAKAIFTVAHQQRGAKRIPVYSRVCAAQSPPAILVDDSPPEALVLRKGDCCWVEFIQNVSDDDVLVTRPPDSAMNILFSSGTSGVPKAVPWDHTTPIKSASDGHYHHDLHVGDIVAWPTSLGWMMGPWLIFATLINRGTVALFDDSPLESAFGRFIELAGVTLLGVVPSMVNQWRNARTMERFDWSDIRLLSSTGECSNAVDMAYLSRRAGGKPIIEYCGGTEVGGGYLTSTMIHDNEAGRFTTPALGSAMMILDDRNEPAERGEVMLVPPCMGLSRRLVGADHDEVYYRGMPAGPKGEVLRRHGDMIEHLPSGGYRVLGRVDDTMNLAGIKVSAGEIESVLMEGLELEEVAAIAVPPPGGGPDQLVICVACDRGNAEVWAQRQADMQAMIRTKLNPLFKIYQVICLEKLPRTASNKILRRELRRLALEFIRGGHKEPGIRIMEHKLKKENL